MRQRRLFPIALTVSELADSLGIDRNVIYSAIKSKELAIFRRGVRRLIIVADAVQWIRETWKREF